MEDEESVTESDDIDDTSGEPHDNADVVKDDDAKKDKAPPSRKRPSLRVVK